MTKSAEASPTYCFVSFPIHYRVCGQSTAKHNQQFQLLRQATSSCMGPVTTTGHGSNFVPQPAA
jgi:hypothetical protein